VGFLAIDIGFSLYSPGRLNAVLPFSVLKVIGGDIQVQDRNSLAWETAADGASLEPGSRLRTDDNGYVSLSFFQGTTATLEPGTDVIISGLDNDGENQLNGVTLRQKSGKTWSQVTRLEDDSYYFTIETPSADIKVRGTLFSTEVDKDGQTTVQTTEGAVSVSAQGEEVQVGAGQQTIVMPGQAPSAPEPIPPAASEMVLTMDGTTGLLIAPSGSSTGYLPDGTPLNQIIGSRLFMAENESQIVSIPEPDAGPYTVELNGMGGEEAGVSVDAYAEGKLTMHYAENVSAGDNLMLKLHLDILNGLLGNADDVKPAPAPTVAPPEKTAPPGPSPAGPEPPVNTEQPDFSGDSYLDVTWLIIGGIVVVLVALLVIAWKKM